MRNCPEAVAQHPQGQLQFCRFCICEAVDESGMQCPKRRFRECGKRWCCKHQLERTPAEGQSGCQYVNRHGIWSYGRGWCLELKMVARAGFILEELTPQDLPEFVECVCQVGPPVAGQRLSPALLSAAFLAQAIKWPPVVKAFRAWVLETPLQSGADCIQMYRKCIDMADGHTWHNMFDRMNAGGPP